jgi:hypothetical protein
MASTPARMPEAAKEKRERFGASATEAERENKVFIISTPRQCFAH